MINHNDGSSARPQNSANLAQNFLRARRMVDYAPTPDEIKIGIGKFQTLGIHFFDRPFDAENLKTLLRALHRVVRQIDASERPGMARQKRKA